MSPRPEAAALLALLLGGCAAEANSPAPEATSWFTATPLKEPPCTEDAEPPPLERTVSVQLFRHPSVDDAALASITGAVASWWGERGLRFVPAAPLQDVDLTTVFSEDGDYSALRAFLDTHARPAAPRLQLVVVPRVVPASSPLPPAGGFALPIAGTTPADPLFESLRSHLGREPWTPTAFLSLDSWRRRGRQPVFRWMPAHEVGHLFGLRHSTAAGNLMTREPSPCAPGLTDEQLRRVAGALDALGDPS